MYSYIHCREEGCIVLYIPEDQEMTQGPRPKPEGHLKGQGEWRPNASRLEVVTVILSWLMTYQGNYDIGTVKTHTSLVRYFFLLLVNTPNCIFSKRSVLKNIEYDILVCHSCHMMMITKQKRQDMCNIFNIKNKGFNAINYDVLSILSWSSDMPIFSVFFTFQNLISLNLSFAQLYVV